MRAIFAGLMPMLVAFPLSAQRGALLVRDTTQSRTWFMVEMKEGTFVVRTVEGLVRESDAVEKASSANYVPHQTGHPTVNRVRLTMAMTEPNPFVAWRNQVMSGAMTGARRTVRVVVHGPDGHVAGCYTLHDAWPSRSQTPTFPAEANQPRMLMIELTYLGVDYRAAPCERS